MYLRPNYINVKALFPAACSLGFLHFQLDSLAVNLFNTRRKCCLGAAMDRGMTGVHKFLGLYKNGSVGNSLVPRGPSDCWFRSTVFTDTTEEKMPNQILDSSG